MSNPLSFSVITPSYNQGDYIEQTIQSVIFQDYPSVEHIIVDGGSTDQTLDILKKYNSDIEWVSEPDDGQSHAINKGLRLATGDIISYLNSDDYYEPGAIAQVAEFFTQHPQAEWVTGKCCTINSDGKENRKAVTTYRGLWRLTRSYKVLLVLNYISQPATFWRKEVIDDIGPFDETLKYTLDYDYSLRVSQKYKIWVMNENLAKFRIHTSSKTNSWERELFQEDLEVAKRYSKSRILLGLHALHNAMVEVVSVFLLNHNTNYL